jgi:hypothetical protein
VVDWHQAAVGPPMRVPINMGPCPLLVLSQQWWSAGCRGLCHALAEYPEAHKPLSMQVS